MTNHVISYTGPADTVTIDPGDSYTVVFDAGPLGDQLDTFPQYGMDPNTPDWTQAAYEGDPASNPTSTPFAFNVRGIVRAFPRTLGSGSGTVRYTVGSETYDYTLGDPAVAIVASGISGSPTLTITNNTDDVIQTGLDLESTNEILGFEVDDNGGTIPSTALCATHLYVCRGSDVQRYDPTDQSLIDTLTLIGGAPTKVTVDASGNAFVAELDTTNRVEKFNSAGVSQGSFGPALGGLGVLEESLMSLRYALSHLFLLAWCTGPVLKLFKIDAGGSLVSTWTVESAETEGQTDLDVAQNGKAYYVEEGNIDGDGNALLRCFNTVTELQEDPALTLNGVDGDDYFGAFRLLLGSTGGCAISVNKFVDGAPDYRDSSVRIYDRNGVLVRDIPTLLGVGGGQSPNPTTALCFGVTMDQAWYGVDGSGVANPNRLRRLNLTTGVFISGAIDPGAHRGITSCTAELGQGFGARRRVGNFPRFIY